MISRSPSIVQTLISQTSEKLPQIEIKYNPQTPNVIMQPRSSFLITMVIQTRLVLILWSVYAICECFADVGTASSYSPPYVPTECYGNDQRQFPAGNLFAEASDAIWDNGAACGRQYSVRCLSGTNQNSRNPCLKNTDSIVVKIVDYCSPDCRGTLQLSADSFGDIADPSAGIINIEYDQV